MKFPLGVNTLAEKIEFAFIAQEKLRIQHNAKGADFRNGVITEAEWNNYLENKFQPAQRKISQAILTLRQNLMISTKYNPDTNDL